MSIWQPAGAADDSCSLCNSSEGVKIWERDRGDEIALCPDCQEQTGVADTSTNQSDS